MSPLPCQAIFGVEKGDDIIALVEQAIGEPCNCKRGLHCPLVPFRTEEAQAAPPVV